MTLAATLALSLGVQPQWQSPYGVGPWGTPQTAQQAAEQQLQAMGATAPEAAASLVPQKRVGEPTCLTARNFLNTQYTVNVGVGGNRFWMVPDSGSFEVLVPSAACRFVEPRSASSPEFRSPSPRLVPPSNYCRDCRCVHSRSACCKDGTGLGGDSKSFYTQLGPGAALASKRVDVTFGQGVVSGRITHDTVLLGSTAAVNQSLLLAESHQVQGYCEGSYDGVLGLGHRRYAREGDADTALLATLGLSSFSICYGRNEDDPGRLVLGGGVPGLQYREVPVVGTRHWAVQLVGVGFGGDAVVCGEGQHCGAIIDSGTSLIAGPRSLMQTLLDQLGSGVEEDCSNVDSLPSLTFRLGTPEAPMDFVLPPRMYVTRSREEAEEAASPGQGQDSTGFLSGTLGEMNASAAVAGKKLGRERCMVVFMELNMEDRDYGPVWILGMPFMRAFSARFSRNSVSSTNGASEDPSDAGWRRNLTVGLAEIPADQNVCAGCPGEDASDRLAGLGVMNLASTHSVHVPDRPTSVSLRHARLPAWAVGASAHGRGIIGDEAEPSGRPFAL